jgi:hypothetical protein
VAYIGVPSTYVDIASSKLVSSALVSIKNHAPSFHINVQYQQQQQQQQQQLLHTTTTATTIAITTTIIIII